MQVQRWDPLREFERLHDEMDRLLRPTGQGQSRAAAADLTFAVDILENTEEVVLRAELPGVRGSDVDVRVEDSVLTIAGEKKFEYEEKRDQYLRVERSYGKFSRSFTLPPYVDSSKILAEYKDGILVLHLPKRPETKPRQIQVKVG